MQYTYPDYYPQFKCIADRCEDTCCAGWQIVIDDEALENYEKVDENHPFKERLNQSIDWEEGVFKQDGCRRCAFLNDKNLCDLYTALGEESLCYTCTNYPRHIEEFEGVREVTLSLSCPEVARILLSKKDKVTFYTEEDMEEDDFDEFDMLMFGILQDVRSTMLNIMQDRSMDIAHRATIIWQMAEELQESIDEGAVFACEDIIDKYNDEAFVDTIISNIKCKAYSNEDMSNSNYGFALNMFKKLYRLEVLDDQWAELLDEASLALYGNGEKSYKSIVGEFKDWLHSNMPDWQIQCEQIVVYFLATYLCGAVYDGWVASKVKMSVSAIFYIHELLMYLWSENGRKLEQTDIIDIVYRYSRELEHSDINLDEMEDSMNE